MALFEARALTVSFGGHNAVTDVDLDVDHGVITGLIGPNGAGKTTIFNAITGLQHLNTGTLILDGRDITRQTPYRRARLGIARTFQRLEIFGGLTTRDNIRVAAEIRRRWAHDLHADPGRDADAILERVGLRAVADERADTLPTGLARLCELGRALAARPRLLLLDEPASGLSEHETITFAKLLRSLAAEQIAVLLVDHDIGLVMDVCASVHVIDYGTLIAVGPPEDIRHNDVVLEAYLGDGSKGASRVPARLRERDDVNAMPVLELRNVSATYNKIEVLHGISLALGYGEVLALLGRNGAGKSTALKVASGQLKPSKGCIHLGGRHINGAAGDALSRIGMCTLPEGRGIFPNLTVRENLVMITYAGPPLARIEEHAYAFFPRLKERRSQLAGTLSGGEQRMLAIARSIVTDPAVLLLDEISMGLAPLVVEELYGLIGEIARAGVSILAVEQFAHIVLGMADVAVVMAQGRVVARGVPSEIQPELSSAYLGADP
ncbi:MAG TPA: ATP-binding cassette domain-containing protein [Acidimicrobiia bacterium]|nr:ATP-binding cassette domain-containing protein [Acidimicrobiia bacterium]